MAATLTNEKNQSWGNVTTWSCDLTFDQDTTTEVDVPFAKLNFCVITPTSSDWTVVPYTDFTITSGAVTIGGGVTGSTGRLWCFGEGAG